MLVKILGGIDLISAFTFLLMVFGVSPPFQLLLFCAGLLFLKGLFIFIGDVLSFVDMASALILIMAIFFMPPMVLLWVPSFLLLAKGIVSFL